MTRTGNARPGGHRPGGAPAPREQRQRAERAGRLAEQVCVWWLRLKGYRVLARDLRSAVGEIDIIARRRDLLCVIEVKRRADFDAAVAAVTPRQQRRIVRAAEAFLARRPTLAGFSFRFDVMLVAPFKPPRHIRDAWRP